ncbi:hypothetical protein D3C78_1951510 [compost metagenome]
MSAVPAALAPNTKMSQLKLNWSSLSCQRMMWPWRFGPRGLAASTFSGVRALLLVRVR